MTTVDTQRVSKRECYIGDCGGLRSRSENPLRRATEETILVLKYTTKCILNVVPNMGTKDSLIATSYSLGHP